MTQLVTTVGANIFTHQPWSDDFRKCPEPNCPRQFNRNKGYIEIKDARIVDHQQVWCRNHTEPKGIVAVIVGERVWQCFHENCLCQQNVHGHKICVGQKVGIAAPKHGRFMVTSIGEDYFATVEMIGNAGDGDHSLFFWDKVPIDDLFPIEAQVAS